jgi:hypothetical protein
LQSRGEAQHAAITSERTRASDPCTLFSLCPCPWIVWLCLLVVGWLWLSFMSHLLHHLVCGFVIWSLEGPAILLCQGSSSPSSSLPQFTFAASPVWHCSSRWAAVLFSSVNKIVLLLGRNVTERRRRGAFFLSLARECCPSGHPECAE